jgi:5-methylcytosine-specific restriction endonuclease McrA
MKTKFNINKYVTKSRSRSTARSTVRNSYGPSWSSLSMAVKRRDGFKCVKCGSSLFLQVHHLIPLSRGGQNMMLNLTTLCSDCHARSPGHGHLLKRRT